MIIFFLMISFDKLNRNVKKEKLQTYDWKEIEVDGIFEKNRILFLKLNS